MAIDDGFQLDTDLGYQTQYFRLWNPVVRAEGAWEPLPRFPFLYPAFQANGVYQLAEQCGYQTQGTVQWLPVVKAEGQWEPVTPVTDDWQPGFQRGEF
jgi:hypothetical protein